MGARLKRSNAESQRRTMDERIEDAFFGSLLATERGRIFLLSAMVHAEENDEQGIFDTLIGRVDDATLQKLVRVHQADEKRHALLLRGCLARYGVEPMTIPFAEFLPARVDRHAGRVGKGVNPGGAGI